MTVDEGIARVALVFADERTLLGWLHKRHWVRGTAEVKYNGQPIFMRKAWVMAEFQRRYEVKSVAAEGANRQAEIWSQACPDEVNAES